MLESKLWHNKTETKNVKFAKMVKFIKTCEQHACLVILDIFQLHQPPYFLLGYYIARGWTILKYKKHFIWLFDFNCILFIENVSS